MSVCISFVAGLGFQSKVAGLSRLLPLEHNLLYLPATDRREQQ